ncbi:TIGR03067 domain-containing protein [Frigoriglobus tundricola]|uniref:TIGR03067 domain-containing protein n=1 Tax=Frigoriglobus tundricola TaxID=2774151 RepID=A0A6M5YS85_9BACT|nr:TIGR03067 domain-containing protein [Frigoriglobus tundricola]QJW96153.1 hypothetical protein FTUN_3709 [Frigoriglobus tundricola]
MPVRALFVAALCVGLATQVCADEKKNETDLKAMVGKWTVEKAELGGKDLTGQFKTLKFEIRDGGKYTTEIGDIKDEGAFTIDAAKTPKEVDIKPVSGPSKGKTLKAIYKIDGDSFVVCYEFNTESGTRPETFESKANSTALLVTYKREKK